LQAESAAGRVRFDTYATIFAIQRSSLRARTTRAGRVGAQSFPVCLRDLACADA
jgi:hypothetical protein